MVGVERIGLLLVEAGRVGVDVGHIESRDHLVEAEHVAVVGDRPTKQRQVIQQTLGDEAAVAVQEQIGLRIALGQFLGALAEHGGQMPELRNAFGHTDAHQRPVQRDLTRRGRQQVLAAQHVGDLHQRVVDRIDQRVQRIAAAAGQREVRHGARRECRLAADEVVPADVLVGHPQPQHRPAAFGGERGALLVGRGRDRSCRSPVSGCAPPRHGAPPPPRASSTPRTPRPRPAVAPPRRGRCRGARTGGRARTVRRPPGPRPSSGRASAARREARDSSPRCRVRRRCPRCRKTKSPPVCRAYAQLNSAVRIRPTCGVPVGDGQNLTRTRCVHASLPLRTTGLVSVPMPSIVMLTRCRRLRSARPRPACRSG